MADQTRIVRWPGNPDEVPAAAVPFALDDAGPALIPPRGASVAAAAIAALFLFADQGHMPTPAAASPSAGTAMSRDRVRIFNWSQGDELPVAAVAFALDDSGEPIRPQQVDRTTSVLWVGGGEDLIPTLVDDAPDWGPKPGPWPAPVLRIHTDPAEGPPAVAAPLQFDDGVWQPLRAFMLPPALLEPRDTADALAQPLPFEDYWYRQLFIPPKSEARIWGAEDEIATPPPALLFDEGYRVESFTVLFAGGLAVAQAVIQGAEDSAPLTPPGSFLGGNPRVWLIDARNRVAHLS